MEKNQTNKFSDYYFEKPDNIQTDSKLSEYFIIEDEYNRLTEEFKSDYKYILDSEDYQNEWGYGKKYLMNDKKEIILLNRFKDEIVTNEAKIITDEETFKKLKETFNIKS